MKVDCHIHTSYSPDGADAPRAFIEKAIDDGYCHICITDHMDLMYSKPDFVGLSDLKNYADEIHALKEEYRKQIYVGVGIECGWTKKNESASAALFKTANIEYVINSVHEVNGSDCYYESHYEGREKDEVYNEYYDAILGSLDAPYKYHAIGHLSYVSRTAPYPNKRIWYKDFSEKIDVILKKIVEKNVILELNTNVYKSGSLSLPDFDVIDRYKELGGQHITFSSDAHRTVRLGDNYEYVVQNAVARGFTHWSVIQNGEMVKIKIDT